jgi:hypothetical protein
MKIFDLVSYTLCLLFISHFILCIESAINLETIKQSHTNAIDELSRELFAMQEQCELLNTEKEFLNSQLEKRPVILDHQQDEQIIGKFYHSWCTVL